MNYIKSVFRIALQNLRKWKTDYRIWVIAVLVFIVVHSQVRMFQQAANAINVKMTPWTYPFLYTQFYTKLLFTLPLLLLFCDAPFLDDNQGFVMIRAGRKRWCCGQLLYIMMAAALYYCFIIVSSIIIALPDIEWSKDWGTLIYTCGHSSLFDTQGIWSINISSVIYTYFTPLQAMWFTFLLSWLSAVFLGSLMYTCNLLTKTQTVGGIICGAWVLLSAFFANENPTGKGASWLSPFSWNTLNQVDVAGMTNCPPFWYCIAFYLTGIIFLNIVILLKNNTMEIVQYGDD